MLDESSEIIGMDIYTPTGIFVGKVAEIGFDTGNLRVDGLIVDRPNPAIAEPNMIINIPFSWVSAISDVILLSRFPERILRDGTLQGL
ncbi:MAG: PRC-barrel domain-containing protein [Candidatus Methanomethylophilaceae archaeon]